jgi:multifunctional methyltransferase subunit TRM112
VLTITQLGLPELPESPPTPADLVESSTATSTIAPESTLDTDEVTETSAEKDETPSQTGQDLHRILLETCIQEGKLVCGSCGHEYAVKEGVANFLLPGHLV